MKTISRIVALGLGLALPLVVLHSQGQVAPAPPLDCGGCLCITPGSLVTIPDGACGITAPGGDTIQAVGGAVTVTTDASNALTSLGLASGAHADVDIVTGAPAFAVIGGGGASAAIDGHGLQLDVNLPGGTLVLTGTGNTVDDANPAGAPARYEATFPGVASNQLNLHGHGGVRVVGPWYVDP